MGLPFEELISYFFPKNISLEEFKFGDNWKSKMSLILSDEIPKSMASLPECLRNFAAVNLILLICLSMNGLGAVTLI